MKQEVRDLSLYVHIPFCKKKCNYCDFLSFGSCSYSRQKQYVEALCKEIMVYKPVASDYRVKTIFIGGGTPSYIEASLMEQIMQTINAVFTVEEGAEITIEGNPDSLTTEKLMTYHRIGINRLSIGLQSANDEVLKVLGRVHNYDQFVAAYLSAKEAGFTNINVDLMSGIPTESAESYIHTLAKVVELKPAHISAYSLIVEEGTPLSQNEALLAKLPSEEEDRLLYAKTKMLLKNSGYSRYEISNYAKEENECKHNIVYWTGGEYLGVGLGAASYLTVWLDEERFEKVRFHGVENMDEYIGRFLKCENMREDEYTNMFHLYESTGDTEPDDFDELYDAYGMYEDMNDFSEFDNSNLSKYKEYENSALLEFLRDYYKDLYFMKRKDEMEEFMFLGLRLMKGVSKAEFKKRFGADIESVYGKIIEKYKKQKLLLEDGDRLYLSDEGIDVSNVIMAEFML